MKTEARNPARSDRPEAGEPHEAAGQARQPGRGTPAATTAAVPSTASSSTVSTRIGKKLISGFFPPATHTRFKVLAAHEQKTQQQLLEEALGLLFKQREARR